MATHVVESSQTADPALPTGQLDATRRYGRDACSVNQAATCGVMGLMMVARGWQDRRERDGWGLRPQPVEPSIMRSDHHIFSQL